MPTILDAIVARKQQEINRLREQAGFRVLR